MKDIHPNKTLWGWGNPEEEREYIERMAADLSAEGGGENMPKKFAATIAYSHLIRYPELKLSCVQTEVWIADYRAVVD